MPHLDIYFLNVGHGDCTFIDFPSGHLTLIDINNSKSLPYDDEVALAEDRGLSLSAFKSAAAGRRSWEDYYKSLLVDPADFYNEHFSGRSIFRYIQTHPDMDHMSGLCRIFWQEKIPLQNFWDLKHKKVFSKEEFDESRYNWNDALPDAQWLRPRRQRAPCPPSVPRRGRRLLDIGRYQRPRSDKTVAKPKLRTR